MTSSNAIKQIVRQYNRCELVTSPRYLPSCNWVTTQWLWHDETFFFLIISFFASVVPLVICEWSGTLWAARNDYTFSGGGCGEVCDCSWTASALILSGVLFTGVLSGDRQSNNGLVSSPTISSPTSWTSRRCINVCSVDGSFWRGVDTAWRLSSVVDSWNSIMTVAAPSGVDSWSAGADSLDAETGLSETAPKAAGARLTEVSVFKLTSGMDWIWLIDEVATDDKAWSNCVISSWRCSSAVTVATSCRSKSSSWWKRDSNRTGNWCSNNFFSVQSIDWLQTPRRLVSFQSTSSVYRRELRTVWT